MNFKDWLQNEIVGIYPPLYSGLAAYPDGYFVNSSYKVYIDASLKAKTNPPQLIKENVANVTSGSAAAKSPLNNALKVQRKVSRGG